jgi:hypothetical protein
MGTSNMGKEKTPEQKAKKAAQSKLYYQEHRTEKIAQSRQYYQDHKAEKAAHDKQYHQDHRTEKVAYDKQYYQNNRAKRLAYRKQYYQNNRAKRLAYRKQYRENHKIEIATQKRNRFYNDIDYKLKTLIRCRIKQSIKNNKQYKHSIDLLGCSIEEVREHIERQFQQGMNWDNWSVHGWHIDHIIPLSYFDFSDPEQQKRACHYTNLRPLWAEDNHKKSDKIEEIQMILL